MELPLTDITELRQQHYNATVTERLLIQDELMILRVHPDGGVPPYDAGQYTTLGLGFWEPRVAGCDAESLEASVLKKLAQRAYSISSPVLDAHEQPVRNSELGFLEFYVVLVRHGEDHAPALTPRLFVLSPGDRLFVNPKPKGHYTLASIRPHDNVIFLATGTGEAPHNAMLAELLHRNHQGRIINVVSVRYERDLGYRDTHRRVEQLWPNYRYVTLATRESPRIEPVTEPPSKRMRLQEFITSGGLADALGERLDPASCHVFLCGNPAMVGVPTERSGHREYPQPVGVIEVLERLGFRADHARVPGNVHFEKYW